MDEIWLPVVEYEGLYEVSNLGRVRSLDRIDVVSRRLKGRVLKQALNSRGYLHVVLCNVKPKTHLVHSLVAVSFIGPRPDGHDVCHGPAGKLDNSVENLSYGSRRKNSADDRNRDNVYSSRFPGVGWDKNKRKFISQITINGRLKYLGYFIEENEAAEAYRKAREELSCC